MSSTRSLDGQHSRNPTASSLFGSGSSSSAAPLPSDVQHAVAPPALVLSIFEAIVTSHPPILESLLAQIPTSSILSLYHTSPYLRSFLASYPLAWKNISFRLPQPALVLGSPGNETPATERVSKQHALDALLIQVVVPAGTRLRSLDLCNTAVSGIRLVSSVLQPRLGTIEHLSVRGCKNVSIKYHILPFLEPYSKTANLPWARRSDLALKSLYTYRCRHHRRRPYLPSSLTRRDSDSEPTHQLIELCHELGIYTDTAWCPTSGGRCFRRKDYHSGRATPGAAEVWVPFDRLWRSGNRIGPNDGINHGGCDGRLWESSEMGHDGEPLGTGTNLHLGEGKDIPAHLRKSHGTFVDNIRCDHCNEKILERCEQCSVRMHCMGCRKTLCASCAFDRPLPKKRKKPRDIESLIFGVGGPGHLLAVFGTDIYQPQFPTQLPPGGISLYQHSRHAAPPKEHRFWWAPGATRSPNLMNESANDEDDSTDSDEEDLDADAAAMAVLPPKLSMHWCCLEPVFSGGGGIAIFGHGVGGSGADKIRAVPLPRTRNYEDPDFTLAMASVDFLRNLKSNGLYDHIVGDDVDIVPFLQQQSLELQSATSPRNLCQDCYRTFRWKVSCRECKKPLCKEHDFRGLKVRKCGFRELSVERDYLRNHQEPEQLVIPAFKPPIPSTSPSSASIADETMVTSYASIDIHQLVGENITAPPDESLTPGPAGGASSTYDLNMTSSISTLSDAPAPSLPHRPRSFSVSNLRNGRPFVSSVWNVSSINPRPPTQIRLPLPCHPRHPVQWEGCGAYFCQQSRPLGDSRAKCPALMQECGSCGVLVCQGCTMNNPTCICSYCTTHFHCPVCVTKPSVQARCNKDAERLAREEADRKEMERREREKEARAWQDELLIFVGEFYGGLLTDGPSTEHVEMIETAELVAEALLPQTDEDGFDGSETEVDDEFDPETEEDTEVEAMESPMEPIVEPTTVVDSEVNEVLANEQLIDLIAA